MAGITEGDRLLLKSVSGITKCDRYYKMRRNTFIISFINDLGTFALGCVFAKLMVKPIYPFPLNLAFLSGRNLLREQKMIRQRKRMCKDKSIFLCKSNKTTFLGQSVPLNTWIYGKVSYDNVGSTEIFYLNTLFR